MCSWLVKPMGKSGFHLGEAGEVVGGCWKAESADGGQVRALTQEASPANAGLWTWRESAGPRGVASVTQLVEKGSILPPAGPRLYPQL